jgi:3-hydroxybutyryl-CoA dehydratase
VKTFEFQRAVIASDLEAFARLTGDHNPIHSEIMHGALLVGLVSAAMGMHCPGPGSVVVEQNIAFVSPCRVGDSVTVRVKLLSERKIIHTNRLFLKGTAKLTKAFKKL